MKKEPMQNLLKFEYKMRFTSNEYYRDHVWKILTESYFQKIIGMDSVVLDLGCGWGEFINNIHAQKKFGMDLNPQCAQKLDDDVVFFNQDCSQTWPFDENTLNVIFTSNFLEHLPNKEHLNKTLSEANRCLKPGGMIICMGPNIRCIPGKYWDFWDHYIPLTDLSMKGFLEINNFIVRRNVGKFLPYTMSGSFQPPFFLLRIYLRMTLAWRIFGKQFLVIGEKKR